MAASSPQVNKKARTRLPQQQQDAKDDDNLNVHHEVP